MASYLSSADNSKKEEKLHKSGGGGGNVIPNPLVAATQGESVCIWSFSHPLVLVVVIPILFTG